MADQPTAEREVGPGPAEGEIGEPDGLTAWKFYDVAPDSETVSRLLQTLPDVFEVEVAAFGDYVQALPQREKYEVESPRPDGRGTYKETKYRDTWTLYMSVAGRVKMAEMICQVNDWRLDYVPEPVTPTGIPGFLQNGDGRIVYREYAVFWKFQASGQRADLGSKPGMAWVPHSGGRAAAGSNPYEKVETAARGRALSAWGIGVLPGSGVASLEEVQGAQENREALRQVTEEGTAAAAPTKSKNDLISEAMTLAEQVRQARGLDEMAMTARLEEFLHSRLGIQGVIDQESGQIVWDRVKTGQVVLLVNSLADSLRQIQNEASDL